MNDDTKTKEEKEEVQLVVVATRSDATPPVTNDDRSQQELATAAEATVSEEAVGRGSDSAERREDPPFGREETPESSTTRHQGAVGEEQGHHQHVVEQPVLPSPLVTATPVFDESENNNRSSSSSNESRPSATESVVIQEAEPVSKIRRRHRRIFLCCLVVLGAAILVLGLSIPLTRRYNEQNSPAEESSVSEVNENDSQRRQSSHFVEWGTRQPLINATCNPIANRAGEGYGIILSCEGLEIGPVQILGTRNAFCSLLGIGSAKIFCERRLHTDDPAQVLFSCSSTTSDETYTTAHATFINASIQCDWEYTMSPKEDEAKGSYLTYVVLGDLCPVDEDTKSNTWEIQYPTECNQGHWFSTTDGHSIAYGCFDNAECLAADVNRTECKADSKKILVHGTPCRHDPLTLPDNPWKVIDEQAPPGIIPPESF
jgi:hypothetical protein